MGKVLIESVENGHIVSRRSGNIVEKRVFSMDFENRKKELISLKEALYLVAEYLGYEYDGFSKYNLHITNVKGDEVEEN